jgi:DNA-binding MarR family transcriptional regulator
MDAPERSKQRDLMVDEIAVGIQLRATRLIRLSIQRTQGKISLTEGGVLAAVRSRPRRITELASREGLTQPAMTRLVTRLEGRGWVKRDVDPADGRVVLVAPTVAGRQMHERLQAEYRALLHEDMTALPDRDLNTLAEAIKILDRLIAQLTAGEDQARP